MGPYRPYLSTHVTGTNDYINAVIFPVSVNLHTGFLPIPLRIKHVVYYRILNVLLLLAVDSGNVPISSVKRLDIPIEGPWFESLQCRYIYIYGYIYIYIYTHIHTCTYIHTYIHTFVRVYMSVQACMDAYDII